ncbi:MAG TPA: anti-sigma factor domain-containing protein [Sedimentibacter sp.]|nr:anti-sigma factor domain-containing protein [Sedimentibacter sp.]HQO95728.1 anti-sigma factor domain-containing protein [Sedimentibacter sp.]
MKAIIVEIKGRHAAVLTDDGIVSKIKNRNYCIGQEIVIKNNRNKLIRMTAAAAAAIMLFVTPAWAYLTPYSYVSIDVNPSFEFLINRFDRVLTVRGFNDDGRELSKDINIDGLKNKEVQNAVKSVLNELKNKGYIIEGQEGGVIIATSSKSEAKKDVLFEKLRTAVNEEEAPEKTKDNEIKTKIEKSKEPEITEKLEEKEESAAQQTETIEKTEELTDDKSEKPGNRERPERRDKSESKEDTERREEPEGREKSERREESERSEKSEKPNKYEKPNEKDRKKNVIEVIEVSKKEVDEAKKLKVTPGKLTLIKKLQEAANEVHRGHEIDQDEWRHESVQEINAKIREYREELRQKQKETENKNHNKKDTSYKSYKNENKDDEDSHNSIDPKERWKH